MTTYHRRHDVLSSTSDRSIEQLSRSEAQRRSHELKRASDMSVAQCNAAIAVSDSGGDALRETMSSLRELATVLPQDSAGIQSFGRTRLPMTEQALQWQRAEALFKWSAQQLAAGVGEPGQPPLAIVS